MSKVLSINDLLEIAQTLNLPNFDELVRPEFPKHFSDSQSKVCQFH